MAHAPCRFVGDADLALDFLGRDAVPRSGEQEHHEKPVSERRARLLKGRSGGRIDLMAAMLARIAATAPNSIIVRGAMAALADEPLAVSNAHQVL